jgi:hypothetical protein
MTFGGQWTGQPALIAHPDGRLTVLAVGSDGHLYGKTQVRAGVAFVRQWQAVGADGRDPAAEPHFGPASTRVAHLVDESGESLLFARSLTGRTGYSRLGPGDRWVRWRPVATGLGTRPAGNPAASGPYAAGPGLVVRGDSGELLYSAGSAAGDPAGWAAPVWTVLGGRGLGRPLVGIDPDAPRRIVLFAVGPGREVWTNCGTIGQGGTVQFRDGWLPGVAAARPGARVTGHLAALPGRSVAWRGDNGSIWVATVRAPGLLGGVHDLGLAAGSDPVTAVAPGAGQAWLAYRTLGGEIAVRRWRGGRDWEPVRYGLADASGRVAGAARWGSAVDGLVASIRGAGTQPGVAVPAVGLPAIAVGGSGLADVVYRGVDQGLYHLRPVLPPGPATPVRVLSRRSAGCWRRSASRGSPAAPVRGR